MKSINKICTMAMVCAVSGYAASASAQTFGNGQSIYGSPATEKGRVIDLSEGAWVNVAYGETVTFRDQNGQTLSWTFDGLEAQSVKVAALSPERGLNTPAVVLIGRNALYRP